MTPTDAGFDFGQFVTIALWIMGTALVLALLLMGWVLWRVRRIKLPVDADFTTALRHTPFVVVLLLDLLDLGLDFLSAPIAWVLLTKLGLAPLRGVTIVEELIPGTQLIPTMTLAWLFVRIVKRR
jgi:uncharacterized iron-regulated membrane protein